MELGLFDGGRGGDGVRRGDHGGVGLSNPEVLLGVRKLESEPKLKLLSSPHAYSDWVDGGSAGDGAAEE